MIPQIRYADPSRCPGCRSAIGPGDVACAQCALPLRGETAQRLFGTLTLADALVARLRTESAPAAAPVPGPSRPAPHPVAPAGTLSRPRGLSAASVPTILLALGAGCLLVAALVFLAVAWSVMGVGGRTATLVVFTGIAAGLAAWTARRGLRAAAESLSLVGYGLLVLDLTGANTAGWFGDLSTDGFLVLLGVVLAAAGAGGAVLARRTTDVRLTGAEVVAAVGTASAALGLGAAGSLPQAPALVLATLLAAGAAVAVHRLRLRVAAAGAVLVTAGSWVSLTGYAVDRTLAHDASWSALWPTLEVWPLLAAALLVGGPALVRRLPLALRVAASAVGHLLVAAALLAPAVHLAPTALALVALAVLAGTGAAAWWLPRPWGLTNLLTQTVTATGVLVAAVIGLGAAVIRVEEAVGDPWSGRAGDALPPLGGSVPAPWLLPFGVLAVAGTCWALAHAARLAGRPRLPGSGLAGAALLGASCVAALALYPVPLWLLVAALLVLAVGCAAGWPTTGTLLPLVPGAGFAGLAVGVSLHAEPLTTGALVVVLGLAGAVHLRARPAEVAAGAGAVLSVAVAASAWTWGALADAEATWAALAGLLVLGAAVLLAPYAPDRWWAAQRGSLVLAGTEAGAAVGACALFLAAVPLAPAGETASWAAVLLTVAGVVVTAMSLLRADRRALGWAGGLLLATASWVRLADLGVHAPEAYTLPSALALLAVGLVHQLRDRDARTMATLSPGLALALVPSLLWVLTDPAGPRVLLLGLACLGLVLSGVRLQWTAPLLLGGSVGALVVLRLAAPYIGDAVPRWVLIGLAGALLITVGATWERRVTEARQVLGAVRALR